MSDFHGARKAQGREEMAGPWWKWPVFSFQLSSSERGELNSSYGQLQVAVNIKVYIKKSI